MNALDQAKVALAHNQCADALAIAQRLLRTDPNLPDAAHIRALALHGLRRLVEARDAFAIAVRLAPRSAQVHANQARVLAALGDYAGTAHAFATAVRLRPGDPLLRSALGNALRHLGRLDEAEIECRGAHKVQPEHPDIAANLAALLLVRGDPEEAETVLRDVLKHHPTHPVVLSTLAGALLNKGSPDAALATLDRIVQPLPSDKALRGLILVSMLRYDEAETEFLDASASQPTADVWARIAATRTHLNDIPGARDAAGKALCLEPRHLTARWIGANLYPPVPQSEEEAESELRRWQDDVATFVDSLDLSSPTVVAQAWSAIRLTSNFSVTYQTHDDVQVQTLFGSTLHRIACARFPHLSEPPKRSFRARPRVGFVSAHFRDHVIMRTHGAWVTDLSDDLERVIYSSTTRSDAVTAEVASRVDRFVQEREPERLIRAIEEDAPDVLIYLDHGMFSPLQLPAALWLAPFQCNGLGHPVTSGLPTFTHALSSDLMEANGAEAHYTERLVRLPGLAQRYRYPHHEFPRPKIPARGEGRVRYLCVQNFQKYMPRHDWIFPEIARQLPGAEFHFVSPRRANLVRSVKTRLDRAFSRANLDWRKHCQIHAAMPYEKWLALFREADIFLDAPGWSGNNTAHDAIACGLPLITWPGKLLRARHVLGILRYLEHTGTVAADAEDYIEIAVALGKQRDKRIWHGTQLWERRERLFDDPAPIQALEAFLLSLCGKVS